MSEELKIVHGDGHVEVHCPKNTKATQFQLALVRQSDNVKFLQKITMQPSHKFPLNSDGETYYCTATPLDSSSQIFGHAQTSKNFVAGPPQYEEQQNLDPNRDNREGKDTLSDRTTGAAGSNIGQEPAENDQRSSKSVDKIEETSLTSKETVADKKNNGDEVRKSESIESNSLLQSSDDKEDEVAPSDCRTGIKEPSSEQEPAENGRNRSERDNQKRSSTSDDNGNEGNPAKNEKNSRQNEPNESNDDERDDEDTPGADQTVRRETKNGKSAENRHNSTNRDNQRRSSTSDDNENEGNTTNNGENSRQSDPKGSNGNDNQDESFLSHNESRDDKKNDGEEAAKSDPHGSNGDYKEGEDILSDRTTGEGGSNIGQEPAENDQSSSNGVAKKEETSLTSKETVADKKSNGEELQKSDSIESNRDNKEDEDGPTDRRTRAEDPNSGQEPAENGRNSSKGDNQKRSSTSDDDENGGNTTNDGENSRQSDPKGSNGDNKEDEDGPTDRRTRAEEPNSGQEPAENGRNSSKGDNQKRSSTSDEYRNGGNVAKNGENSRQSDPNGSNDDKRDDEDTPGADQTVCREPKNGKSAENRHISSNRDNQKRSSTSDEDGNGGDTKNNGENSRQSDPKGSNGDDHQGGSSSSDDDDTGGGTVSGEGRRETDPKDSKRNGIKPSSASLPPQAADEKATAATPITLQPVSRLSGEVDESSSDIPPSVTNGTLGVNDKPQNIEVHPSEENPFSFYITWSSPEYYQPKSYEVTIYEAASKPLCSETVSSLLFTYSKCELDKTYGCMVTTIREDGCKGKSATINFKTDGSLTKPTHLNVVKGEVDPGTFTITWNAPRVPPEQYEVVVGNGIDPSEKQITKHLKIKFEDLKLDSEYNFTVTSLYMYDKKGKAEASIFQTMKGEVVTAQNIVARFVNIGSPHIDVTWDPPAFAVKKYKVELLRNNVDLASIDELEIEKCQTKFFRLSPDEVYFCRITSMYGSTSYASATSTGIKTPNENDEPIKLKLNVEQSNPFQVKLEWKHPTTIQPAEYEISIAQKGKEIYTATTESLKMICFPLALDERYDLEVKSVRHNGKEGNSCIRTFSTDGSVTAVTNFRAAIDSNNPKRIRFEWNEPQLKPERYHVAIEQGDSIISDIIDDTSMEFDSEYDLELACAVTAEYHGICKGRKQILPFHSARNIQVIPTEIKASLDDNNPYDLILTWSPCCFSPKVYDVILLEHRGGSGVPTRQKDSEECKAIFHNLQPETEYSCGVSCKFASHQTRPVISRIVKTPNVNIQCTFLGHGQVECSWNGPRQNYTVELKLNGTVNNPSVVNVPRWSFNYADMKLEIGSMFEIMISAENHFKTEFERFCIGEDTVVKKMEAGRDPQDPFALIVTWDEPRTIPDEYEVKAFRAGSSVDGEAMVSKCKAKITGLKLDTKYSIEVTPLLSKCRGMHGILNNIHSTEKKCTSPTEVQVKQCDKNPFRTIVTWKEPHIAPQNYEVKIQIEKEKVTKDQSKLTKVTQGLEESFTDLPMGEKCQCRVTAIYPSDRRGDTKIVTFQTPSMEDMTPKALKVKPDPFELHVSWKPPTLPSLKYKVLLFTRENATAVDQKETECCDWTFTSLRPNTNYICLVESLYGGDREGGRRKSSAVKTTDSKLSCRTLEGQVECSWAGDNNQNYSVLLNIDGNAQSLETKEAKIMLNLTTYKIVMGKEIEITVSRQTSNISSAKFIVGSDTKPESLQVVPSAEVPNEVQVSWIAPTNKVNRYKVTIYEEHGTNKITKEVAKTKASFSSLKMSTRYTVTVLSMLGSTEGIPVTAKVETTNAGNTCPKNVEVSPIESDPFKIRITWNRPTLQPLKYEVQKVNGYHLHQDQATTKNLEAIFTMSELGDAYKFKITPIYKTKGKNRTEGSAAMSEILDTAKDKICKATEPSKPRAEMSKTDPFLFTISWGVPTIIPEQYEVTMMKDGKTTVHHTNEIDKTFSIDKIGPVFHFSVRGVYRRKCRGLSASSDKLNTSEITCTLPRDVQVKESGKGPFSVFVNWQVPKAICESYEFEIIEKGASIRTEKCLCKNGREISELKESTSYFFAVTSIYKHGARGLTAKSREYKTVSEKETAPKNVIATANSKNPFDLSLTWQPASLHPKHYEVTLICDKTVLQASEVDGTVETFTYTKLTPDTKYRAKIIAVFSDGIKSFPAHSNEATTGSRIVLAPRHIEYRTTERQVILTWQKPETSLKLLKFSCKMKENGTLYESKECTAEKCEVSFAGLRNGYTYRCLVYAKYENCEEAHADVKEIFINTKRDANFDVKESGCPKHLVSKISFENGKLVCKVSWFNPDLGMESQNFTRKKQTVTLFEKKHSNSLSAIFVGKFTWNPNTTEDCDSAATEHTFENLGYEDYRIGITYTYLDLDSRQLLESTTTKEFSMGVETPKNIQVTWKGEQLTMTWDKALGATQYKVSIIDPVSKQSYIDPGIQKETTFITNMTRTCRYGQWRIFKVAGMRENVYSKTTEKELLIGDKRVATDLELVVGDEDPRRQLRVSWKHPEEVPDEYELTLKSHNDKVVIKVTKKKEDAWHTFSELQPEQPYYCELLPKYKILTPITGSTWTNEVKTLKRVLAKYETLAAFGYPGEIDHKLEEKEMSYTADMTWKELQSTQNFVFKGYQVQLDSDMENKIIFWSQKTPHLHAGLTYGLKYTLEVTSIFLDRDSLQPRRMSRSLEFFTKPQKPKIERCTWNAGILTFRWTKQPGAKYYALHVKDENLENEITLARNLTGNAYDAEMKGNLRMGKTCMIKVSAIGEDSQTNSTEFSHQRIGNEDVPRNVTATMNKHESDRRVDIKLDQPICEEKPVRYRVVAVSKSRRSKEAEFKFEELIVFKDLRKGENYHFKVHAIYAGGGKSEGGCSNDIQTPKDATEVGSALNFSNMDKANISIGHVEAPKVNIHRDHPTGNFAQVTSLKATSRDSNAERAEKTVHDVKWSPPIFGEKQYDYKIYRYNMKIVRYDGTVLKESKEEFKKGASEYEVCAVPLDNGYNYEVQLTTEYEVIDADRDYVSEPAKKSITTKPGPTGFTLNEWSDGNLVLKWTRARGANGYRVEIWNDKEQALHQSEKSQKRDYLWKPEQSDFGSRYKVKVVSISEDEKENHMESDYATLGGDRVPKFVNAENAEESEEWKQACVTWEEPTTIAGLKYYNVVAIEEDTNNSKESYETGNTECMVGGLRAGTQYRFQVTATYDDGKTSYGSLSSTIKTDPKPNQVRGVIVERDHEHSTPAIRVSWKREDQISLHEVEISSEDSHYKRKLESQKMPLICDGLRYGHTYIVKARAGNASGFGVWSEGKKITTVHGMPGSVFLDFTSLTSKSADLRFARAPETPSHYGIKIIRKQRGDGTNIQDFEYKFPSEGGESNQQKIDSIKCIFSREENCQVGLTRLQPNTEYTVKLHAHYGGNRGDDVEITLLTAPARAQKPTVNVVKNKDWYSSKDVVIELPGQEGCDCHEIRVLTGDDSTENQFILAGQRQSKYTCKHESAMYKFQFRSKNASEKYGEWSEMTQIQLAPTALKNVKAVRSGYNILLSWDAPTQTVSKIYVQVREDDPFVIDEKATLYAYKPTVPSTGYNFLLFAVMALPQSEDIPGEAIRTGEVISKPDTPETFDLKAEGTTLTISWKVSKYNTDRHDVKIIRTDLREAETRMHAGANETRCSCKDLCPGKRYEVMIRYVYKDVKGDWSNPQFARLAPGMVEVTEFKIQELYLTLKWNPVEGENTKYYVELFENDDKETIDCYDGKYIQQWESNKIKRGRTYNCKIAASNKSGIGSFTKTDQIKSPWDRNVNLNVDFNTPDPTKIVKITWKKPEGVNRFRIGVDQVPLFELSEAEYVFCNGTPGHTHVFRLYCGSDDFFDTEGSTKSFTMHPARPEKVIIKPDARDPSAIFIAVTDQGLTPRKRRVVVLDNRNAVLRRELFETHSQQREIRIEKLDPGKEYYVGVASVEENGFESSLQYSNSVMTYPCQVIDISSEKVGNNSQRVKWADVTDAKYYEVHWNTKSVSSLNSPLTRTFSNEILLEELSHSTTYRVKVRAVNDSGGGCFSESLTFITDPPRPEKVVIKPDASNPSAIFIVVTDPGTTHWKWRVVVFDNNNTDMRNELIKIQPQQRQIRIEGLVPGKEYFVGIASVDKNGSESSLQYSKSTMTYPCQVTGLTVEKVDIDKQRVKWSVVNSAKHYEVHWNAKHSTSLNSPFKTTFSNGILLEELKHSTMYSVKVRAVNNSGEGPFSESLTFNTVFKTPQNVTMKPNPLAPQTSIIVSFVDNHTDGKQYIVKATSKNDTKQVKRAAEARDIVMDELQPGESYQVQLQAVIGELKSKIVFAEPKSS